MSSSNTSSSATDLPQKRESMLANMLLNIVIPTLILMKGSESAWLLAQLQQLDLQLGFSMATEYQNNGTKWVLVVALMFPILYGLHSFVGTKKVNLFSVLGTVSILLTGGIGLLELDPKYIAIKEAAIPGILGLVTVLSLKTRFPIVKTFLYSDKILQVARIAEALKKNGSEEAFERTLVVASWILSGSFFLSSFLNYVLAKWIVVSPAGTAAFNEELGKMTALSFPVISVPAMIVMFIALFYLFRNIRKLTGLTLEDIMVEQ